MPRKMLDDLRAGQLLKWNVVRGKCSYGDNHESVRLIGFQWYGESSNSYECTEAPKDICPICSGVGTVEMSEAEAELLSMDGTVDAADRRKPCEECEATGFVAGPHWPWRHPHPGPLKRGH